MAKGNSRNMYKCFIFLMFAVCLLQTCILYTDIFKLLQLAEETSSLR
jgi:hypothetical protein